MKSIFITLLFVKHNLIKKQAYCTFMLMLICQLGMAQVTPEKNNEDVTSTGFLGKNNPPLKGMILGVHGARETMFEIGYFYYEWVGGSGKNYGGRGYSISTEHYINKNYIIVPKIAVLSNLWGINTGIATLWYFDKEKNNSLRVRPEIGYGSGYLKLTYAYNIAITNKDMNNVSKHMISAVYFLNFNKKSMQGK